MALNLIKVPTDEGNIIIGVAHIIAVLPNKDNKDRCFVMMPGFPSEGIELHCTAQAVADLANRRPPDGF